MHDRRFPAKALLAGLLLLLLVAAACGAEDTEAPVADDEVGDPDPDEEDVGEAEEPVDADAERIPIATIGPMSGAAAEFGISLDRAAKLFIEDLEERGGFEVNGTTYLVDHVVYDTRGEPGETATVVNRAIFEDGVQYILGNSIGATCEAAQAITEPESVMFTFTCWGTENTAADKPRSFRQLAGPVEATPLLYNWISDNHPEVQRVAFLNPNDQSGFDAAIAAVEVAEELGWDVVVDEYYERGVQEMSPILTRVIAQEPDLIDLGGSSAGDAAVAFSQLHELGYEGNIAFTSLLNPVPLLETAGADAIEGLWAIIAWDMEDEVSHPNTVEFAERFRERWGEPADLITVSQYAAWEIVTHTMSEIGSTDPTEVSDGIREIGVFEDTALGTVCIGGEEDYGIAAQFLYPLVVTETVDGEPQALELIDVDC